MYIKEHKGTFQLIGFLLILINMVSLILGILGLEFTWLKWMGPGDGLVVMVSKLVLMMIGFTLLYIATADFEGN